MDDTTLQLLRDSLDRDPSNWELRAHLCQLASQAGRSETVSKLTEKEGLQHGSDVQQVDLAQALAADDRALAMTVLQRILELNRKNAAAHFLKAELHRAAHEHAEARLSYNMAAVIDERFEDDEFEAWLGQVKDEPAPTDPPERRPLPNLAAPAPDPDETAPLPHSFDADFEEDDDVFESDDTLDQLFAASANIIDFGTVGGMEELKNRVRMSIIHPFKNKELFAKFKKKSGGGLLLYGPPGCGKTLISRATAGECGAHFIEVSIHDVLSKWIGEAEQRLHQLFETARRKSPTIIFIDEIDALGVKRSDAGNSANIVNTLLTEIDGASSNNEDVLVIGATNTPWRIDSAFRRPGRFDHVVFVPPPDLEARVAILEIALEGIPQEKLNLVKLAEKTERFSGADLRAVIERASEKVLEKIMTTGKEEQLSQKELLQAIVKHRPTTLEWLEQASNYASYANQSGLYDELATYLEK